MDDKFDVMLKNTIKELINDGNIALYNKGHIPKKDDEVYQILSNNMEKLSSSEYERLRFDLSQIILKYLLTEEDEQNEEAYKENVKKEKYKMSEFEVMKRHRLESTLLGVISELAFYDEVVHYVDIKTRKKYHNLLVEDYYRDRLNSMGDEGFIEFKKKLVDLIYDI